MKYLINFIRNLGFLAYLPFFVTVACLLYVSWKILEPLVYLFTRDLWKEDQTK